MDVEGLRMSVECTLILSVFHVIIGNIQIKCRGHNLWVTGQT